MKKCYYTVVIICTALLNSVLSMDQHTQKSPVALKIDNKDYEDIKKIITLLDRPHHQVIETEEMKQKWVQYEKGWARFEKECEEIEQDAFIFEQESIEYEKECAQSEKEMHERFKKDYAKFEKEYDESQKQYVEFKKASELLKK